MTATTHGRSGRPWRRLREQVLFEEPYCQIRGPKCTGISTTVDHIVALSKAPELAHVRENLRGSCGPCNYRRAAQMTNGRRKRSATPLTCACWPHCRGVHRSRDWDAPPYQPSEDWT